MLSDEYCDAHNKRLGGLDAAKSHASARTKTLPRSILVTSYHAEPRNHQEEMRNVVRRLAINTQQLSNLLMRNINAACGGQLVSCRDVKALSRHRDLAYID